MPVRPPHPTCADQSVQPVVADVFRGHGNRGGWSGSVNPEQGVFGLQQRQNLVAPGAGVTGRRPDPGQLIRAN